MPPEELSKELSQELSGATEDQQVETAGPIQSFLIGAFLSGLIVFVYLTLSLEMTHMSLAAVSKLKLGVAIAVPILFGLISALYRERATQLIATALESVNLPF